MDLGEGAEILQRLHLRALARLGPHDQAVLGPPEQQFVAYKAAAVATARLRGLDGS